MAQGRAPRPTLVCALALPAVAVAAGLLGQACLCVAGAPEGPDALHERIVGLRLEARYDEATEAARELLALVSEDAEVKAFDVTDAEWLVRTLEHAAGLPEDARAELALADSLAQVCTWSLRTGHFSEGAEAARRQLEIRRDLLGAEHPDVAASLNHLAMLLQKQGDYASAGPLFREALALRRELLGDNHPDVGASLNNLAMLVQEQGDYAGAEKLHREALAVFRACWGNDHRNVAASLNNLGMVLQYQGDHAGAEPLYRESLDIRRRVLGDRHRDVAATLNNLASLMYLRCDYAAAEPLLREATAIWRAALGSKHPSVALSMNNLASLLNGQGDYAGAEQLYREALSVYREVLPEDHPQIARSLSFLAHVLENQGDYASAEPLVRDALSILRRVFEGSHPEIAECLNALAHLLQVQGDYASAEPLYEEALAMRRELLGEKHLDVATSLSNLASLLEAKGDYDGAERLFGEALAIRREVLGEESAVVAHNVSSLGLLLQLRGDHEQAVSVLEEAASVYAAARVRAGSGLARADISVRFRCPCAALAVSRLELGEGDEAWPAAEQSLARALADLLLTAERRDLSELEAAEEDSLKEEIALHERALAAFEEAARGDTSAEAEWRVEQARNNLAAAEADWSAFETAMAAEYPVTEGQVFTLERVQAALSEGAALIGWLDVTQGSDDCESWGYVIRRSGPVAWGRLEGRSGSPHKRARKLRGDLGRAGSSSIGVGRDARDMWAERVEPLVHALDGVEDLIVIPSGAMLGVPVEALTDREGVTVGERYAVSYVPSATIHAWITERAGDRPDVEGERTLLLGDPPFTEDHLAAMMQETCADDGSEVRSGAASDGVVAALPRLSGSRDEVAGIATIAPEPTILLGPEASEDRLADMVESGELAAFETIHLATHALMDDVRPERSSLVLSQVNLPDALEAILEGSRVTDGLLTAKEIVREWDIDADLVTLSACETGLGKEVGGEGYIGFAHAFLQAGARSLLVSLWRVEDRATSLLMRRFYENRWGAYEDERADRVAEPMPKALALREAKQWLRIWEDERGRRPYEHPYYWSAFILIGERG